MTATNQITSGSKALGTYNADYSPSKALSTGKPKNLGGDPALAAWVEQNRYVYDSIVNGTSDLSQSDQALFMDYWSFAMSGLQQSWDPSMGAQGGQYPAQGQPLPPGAIPGAQGNAIYDQMDANIEHAAYGQPIDIYSNNIVINSGSMMTTFTVEKTTDTRFNPPEEVTKITASDGTCYIVHDGDDANITLKTPVEDMAAINGQPNVTWQQYTGPAAGGSETGQVVNGPAPTKNDAGEWEIEAASMDEVDTIDMKPTGSGVEGSEETWRVWGHLNVSVAPSDKVQILDGADNAGDGGYRIVITHKDGSKDVIIAMPGTRSINVNADPLNISWGEAGTVNPSGLVPEGFGDFTVNGGVSVENLSEEEGGFLGEFLEKTGKSIEEVIDAMNEAGLKTADGKSYKGLEDVVKAIKDGHFPPKPEDISYDFIKFLSLADPEFASSLMEMTETVQNDGNKEAASDKMMGRLVELLDTMYPDDVEISVNPDWKYGFIINGSHYFLSFNETGLGDYITRVDVEANKSYKDHGNGYSED